MVLRAHIKCEENGFLAQGTGKNLFLTFCRRTRTTPPYADSTGGRCRDHYNFNASFNIVLVLLPYGTDSKRKRRACAGCRNAEDLKNLQPTSQETSLNIRRWNVRLRSSSSSLYSGALERTRGQFYRVRFYLVRSCFCLADCDIGATSCRCTRMQARTYNYLHHHRPLQARYTGRSKLKGV